MRSHFITKCQIPNCKFIEEWYIAYAKSLREYAYNFLLGAVPDIFDEVDRHGFFNIEGAPMILELEKDAAYQKALEERNK